MKPINTEIEIRKDGEKYLVTHKMVDEFTKEELENNVITKLENDKRRIQKELEMDKEAKKMVGELDDFKRFVLDKVGVRFFSEEEIKVKEEQIKLVENLIRKVRDAL